jgi:membrane-associated phospholipid phosphatase
LTLALCGAFILLWPNELRAFQARQHGLRPADAWLTAAWGAAALAPRVFDVNHHPPSCAPCDVRGIPWFDRWAVTVPRDGLSAVSSGVVFAMAALESLDLARGGPARYGDVAYLSESAGWALGAGEVLKAIVARKRPVLYTAGATAAEADRENQRSWPSDHAAVAAALAAGYLLVPRGAPVPAWRRWAVVAAATSVGVLRVASGRHFPSDVVSGAALGVVSAVTVRAIRF